jgi:serine/threonine protein kinase
MKIIRDVEGTIQLFDVIHLDSSPLVFLVMELAKENLMEYLLKRKKAFNEEEAREVFVQLAKTLNTLHQRNIVHRDIKLENIYISLAKYISPFENFSILPGFFAEFLRNFS